MTRTITIGYSPCPNDTFIFYGLVHNKVKAPGLAFQEQLEDVETLNHLARKEVLDVTKISYHAFGHLRDRYVLLRSGGALGRGCGPLIVARPGTHLADLGKGDLAIPGELTTAYLLLRMYQPSIRNIVVMPFDRIMDAVAQGRVAAGLIIHESRFTYPQYGLEMLLDLGEWWERYSGLPIPLGGILGKRTLGAATLLGIEQAIRDSLVYARMNRAEVLDYCREHSQEMDAGVMQNHIDLYVNDLSLDLGEQGTAAVRRLIAEAESRGIFPPSSQELFVDR
ncbi:MAG: 1,4-dihydroxy-6-naphthoate synthase [Nitrospirota bacterium]|nr:1,4-dihydroxy-6-naphthoate synthase [Nitrospirota bacterium]